MLTLTRRRTRFATFRLNNHWYSKRMFFPLKIVFPAGVLQPPFFASSWYAICLFTDPRLTDVLNRPGYLSYGAFGHVASHELTVSSFINHSVFVCSSHLVLACLRLLWSTL